MVDTYDFGGWATRHGVKCSDGLTIMQNAFADNDGVKVPLVWNHEHNMASNVLGHAILENRAEGVYAYCSLNDTEGGRNAREQIKHGDIDSLSIYANNLTRQGNSIVHGLIREVSLVLAGANPDAHIDNILMHGEYMEDDGVIYPGVVGFDFDDSVSHSEEDPEDNHIEHADEGETNKTIGDILESMTDEQRTAVEILIGLALKGESVAQSLEDDDFIMHADEDTDGPTIGDIMKSMSDEQREATEMLVGMALAEADNNEEDDDNPEGGEEMKQNAFNREEDQNAIMHTAMAAIIKDGKRCGSLKESFLQHAQEYGIENIDYLFPDAQNVMSGAPSFIKRNPDGWVNDVMNGVHHTPFARIKMVFADITADEARARGYVKGKIKLEEVFTLLKRVIEPTTIYKKQKLDRDDIIDITDFDVVAWLKTEMRMVLNEEIARAILFGDGRSAMSDDKINEANIIPVSKDHDLYAMKVEVKPATNESFAHAFIVASVKSQDEYEGGGNITLFVASSTVTEMLLMEDKDGHRMYKDLRELALALNVNKISKVPASIIPSGIYGVALDLNDYNVGADKGGAINMFEDFDIDYNQEKYLIETRCSGGLTKPKSAIVFKAPEV